MSGIDERELENKSEWWIKECSFCDWVWDMSKDYSIRRTYVVYENEIYCPDCWRKMNK